jgi:ABC-2 type transport system permease protein
MNALSGTWRLFRLAVRLDRIRLPIWILANAGIVFLTLPQLIDAYGSQKQIIAYASATAPSVVTRLLNGAITGPSMGEITIVETYISVLLIIALMNIFLIVRHTRQNEETNRSELMESMEVGRQAGLTAALILAFLANLITSLLIFIAFRTNDLPTAGAGAYSIAIGLTGMSFAGIAAITSQLHQNARTASGLAGLVFGISFMIRGIGDALGTLQPGGLGVKTNLLSWFSPAAWAPNMRPFAGELWWVVWLYVGFIGITITSSYILLAKRDVGEGLFAPRPGRVNAKPNLLRQFGLTNRLNRVTFVSWWLSFVAIGLTLGSVAHEFEGLIAGNEEMQKMLSSLGGADDISSLMFGATFTIAGIAAAGYALQVLTRMRKEESSGRLELLLSTKKSRSQWLSINLVYSLITVFLVLLCTGLAAGLAYGIIDGNIMSNVVKLGSAILVHLPAIALLAGLSLVIFGMFPRHFVSITWTILAVCLLIFQLDAVLDLPQMVMNLSPFTHTPPVPATSVNYTPLIIQSIIAIILICIGFGLFRRRDLITE